MPSRTVLALVFCLILARHGLAEQPSVRIDLSVPRHVPSFVAIPFVFEDGNLDCPDDRRTVAVTNGMLKIYRLNLPPIEPSAFPTNFPTKTTFDPIDDSTYRLELIRSQCRVDIDIRQQVRVAGEWKSLLVIEERRPSLSEEARKEAVRKRLGDWPAPRMATPETIAEINNMLRGKGPRRWGPSTLSFGFPFDDAPKSCMDVFGEYQITKVSFAMAFFTPLPGELNKFVMEGSDLDSTHAGVVLTKDDCRFEFTVSQSVMHNGQWIALPLRPIPDDKVAKPADSAH
jgi:hypothetical protein